MKTLDERIRAAKVRLGIRENEWTDDEVREAYANRVRRLHPDQGGKGSGEDIARAKLDKALLIKYATPKQWGNPCPHCKGSGYVAD